jgi:uncharacterized protein YceH (UPF0502 family)
VLLLRGPQTPGELRGRTERLYHQRVKSWQENRRSCTLMASDILSSGAGLRGDGSHRAM